jgi:hypothetical protein
MKRKKRSNEKKTCLRVGFLYYVRVVYVVGVVIGLSIDVEDCRLVDKL